LSGKHRRYVAGKHHRDFNACDFRGANRYRQRSATTITTSVASGSVFPVGTTTVNVTGTDAAGNSSSCSFTVTELYNFAGFFSPVGNPPILNSVNAGKAIPVKFSLSGNKGLAIFAADSPYTVSLNCNTSGSGCRNH
jgi:hypothetical protein